MAYELIVKNVLKNIEKKIKYNSLKHPDFQKCWALENLRPYSAKQNIIDGARTSS